MKSIQILRPGKFRAMNGKEFSFAAADLETIAKNYDPKLFASPIVVGHPKTEDPAFGWIKAANFADGILTAEPEKLEPQFADMVAAGLYKKVSASLFAPDHPSNPKPGEYYLKHVGFLGAAAPAIPGLQPVNLAGDNDEICIELSVPASAFETNTQKEENLNKEQLAIEAKRKEQDERENRLNAKEKGIRRAEFSAFVGDLKKDGKILPAFESDLVNFIESLDSSGTIEFAADKKATPIEFFKNYLAKQPNVVEFAEIAGEKGAQNLDKNNPAAIAERAVAYKQKLENAGTVVSFSTAVERVMEGKDAAVD